MQPVTLAEDSLNDRHQSSTSSIHKSPLVLWQEKRPNVDPVHSLVNNLKKLSMTCLVKITSLRQFQIAHIKAHTPIRIQALIFLSIPFSKLPNIFLILVGAGILKVK
jgi:hypothetical protein